MNDMQKRKKIRQYFSKIRFGWAIFLALAGGAAMVFGLSIGFDGELIAMAGLLLAILGGIMFLYAVVKFVSRPSDSKIDKWFEEDLQQIHKHAVQKLGLGEDLLGVKKEPLRAIGPIWWSDSGVPKKDLLFKQGKDGITRYSVYEVLLIYTAEHVLAAYSCDFNTLKNVMLNESSYEFHYQDIVSVATRESSTSYTLPNKQKLVDSQEFSVSVSSGESIGVVIKSDKLNEITKGEIPFKDEVENTISRLRSLLRDKKQPSTSTPLPINSSNVRAEESVPYVAPPTDSDQETPSASPPVDVESADTPSVSAPPPEEVESTTTPSVSAPPLEDAESASAPSISASPPVDAESATTPPVSASQPEEVETTTTPSVSAPPPTLDQDVSESFCSNCGTELNPSNKFCPGCGRELNRG